jgi:hypothetical protein
MDAHAAPLEHELEGAGRWERPDPEPPMALVGLVAAGGFAADVDEHGGFRPVGWCAQPRKALSTVVALEPSGKQAPDFRSSPAGVGKGSLSVWLSNAG